MFRSLSLDRFRGFSKLRVEPLDRINLILGKNNTGKTALLEAIFLLAGPTNPELPLRLNLFRGIEQVRADPEDMWGWLFYKKRIEHDIWIKAEAEIGRRRAEQLTISLGKRRELPLRAYRPKTTGEASQYGFDNDWSLHRTPT